MMRRLLALRKKAPEVVEAERVQGEQFTAADAVLEQVAAIRKAASTIAQYAQADKLRREHPR